MAVERFAMLNYAVDALKARPNSSVYLDGTHGAWLGVGDVPQLNTSGINLRYTSMLGDTQPTTHFVIDTSRNGQCPWQPPVSKHPEPQD